MLLCHCLHNNKHPRHLHMVLGDLIIPSTSLCQTLLLVHSWWSSCRLGRVSLFSTDSPMQKQKPAAVFVLRLLLEVLYLCIHTPKWLSLTELTTVKFLILEYTCMYTPLKNNAFCNILHEMSTTGYVLLHNNKHPFVRQFASSYGAGRSNYPQHKNNNVLHDETSVIFPQLSHGPINITFSLMQT